MSVTFRGGTPHLPFNAESPHADATDEVPRERQHLTHHFNIASTISILMGSGFSKRIHPSTWLAYNQQLAFRDKAIDSGPVE
jgi:hypothetical protein